MNINISYTIRFFLSVFIPFSFLIIITAYIFYLNDIENENIVVEFNELATTQLKKSEVENEFKSIKSDLRVLSSHNALIAYWETGNQNYLEPLSKEFYAFIDEKSIYDQLRLLSLKGNEIIRINYNDANPIVIPKSELQNKSNRYYFKETSSLEENEFFISPLDLNVEKNKIEIPYKPMIRFGIPLFNRAGNKKGIIIINYLAQNLLDLIETKHFYNYDQLMLLNSKGYWLISPESENEWGFMFDDKKHINCKNYYPEIWENISKKDDGQFRTSDGLYTFTTIYPLIKHQLNRENTDSDTLFNSKSYFWKIVSFVPDEHTSLANHKILKRNITISVSLILFLAIGTGFLTQSRIKNKNAEDAQKKYSKELSELNKKLLLSQKNLKTENANKDKFFSILAHDLRNPFNALIGMSEMILEDKNEMSDEEIFDFIESIKDTSKGVYGLLENLLQWSMIHTGRLEFTPKEFDINETIINTLQLAKANIKNKKLQIEVDVPSHLTIFADQDIVYTVIRNLISNAIKYTPANGLIKIKTEIKNNEVIISIIDNGIGIPENKIPDLFKVEKIVSTLGTAKEEGTGLGLVLCNSLVLLNGGKLIVESTENKGSKFHFTVPLRS